MVNSKTKILNDIAEFFIEYFLKFNSVPDEKLFKSMMYKKVKTIEGRKFMKDILLKYKKSDRLDKADINSINNIIDFIDLFNEGIL